MFSFRHPLLLLLLLTIPLVVLYLRKRRAPPTFATSDIASLAALPRSPWLRLRHLPAILLALAAALLVVAAAGPRSGIRQTRAETEGVDIVLLVDTSTSMNATDLATSSDPRLTRLEAAKSVIRRFVDDRPDDRIGIVAFSAMPYALAPLTTDHAWLQLQIDRLQAGMLPEDATAIGDAIASAVNRLRPSQAKSKVVILLTDGINNHGRLAPLDAARAAAALSIKVYAVGAASDKPQTVSTFFGPRLAIPGAEIDEDTLRQIAEITDALYFRATDADSLQDIYSQIDALEKTPVTLDSYTHYRDLFLPFAAAAALLLLSALVLHATPLATLPA